AHERDLQHDYEDCERSPSKIQKCNCGRNLTPIDLPRDIPKARPGYEQLSCNDCGLFDLAAMRRARRLQFAGNTGAHSTSSTAGMLRESGWWCKLVDMSLIKVGKLAPVTVGHMRSQGWRDLLVYCRSGRCNHGAIMNVGHLPDHTPIKSLGHGIVCAKCGHL